MRNCPNCGYLLPPVWDACKKCGAALGAAVTTATRPSTPAAPPPAIGGGYDPRFSAPARLGFPTAPGTDDASRSGWEPVIKTPTRTGLPVGPFVVLVVVAIVLAGGWFGLQKLNEGPPLPAVATDYIDGGGVTYAPFNEGYSVRLPAEPQVETDSSQGVTVTFALVTDNKSYEVGAGSMLLPAGLPVDVIESQLESLVVSGRTVTGLDVEVISTERIDFQGRTAIDAELKWDDFRARALLIIDDTHLYMLGTHATRQNDELFEALRDSFEFTS